MGEFRTQLAWACNGELLAVTAQAPLGTGGRILTWEKLGTRTQTSAIKLPGLLDINGTCIDPASCTVYLNPGVFMTTPGSSDLYAWQGGLAAPAARNPGRRCSATGRGHWILTRAAFETPFIAPEPSKVSATASKVMPVSTNARPAGNA